jgi:hypothetical protein
MLFVHVLVIIQTPDAHPQYNRGKWLMMCLANKHIYPWCPDRNGHPAITVPALTRATVANLYQIYLCLCVVRLGA